MREMGIALATAISAWINALLLYFFLLKRNNIKLDNLIITNTLKILICSFILVLTTYFIKEFLFLDLTSVSLLLNSLFLILLIILSIIIYLSLVIMLKVITFNQLNEYLKN